MAQNLQCRMQEAVSEFPVPATWLCVTAEGAGAIPEQRRGISVDVCTLTVRGKH